MRVDQRLALWELLGKTSVIAAIGAIVMVWFSGISSAMLSEVERVAVTPIVPFGTDPADAADEAEESDEEEAPYVIVWTAAGFVEPIRVAGSFAALCAAGLALVGGEYRRLGITARISIGTLIAVFLIWSVLAYPSIPNRDMFVGATAPYIWLLPITFVLGMKRTLWNFLYPILWLLVTFTTLLALYSLTTFSAYARFVGPSPQILYLNMIFWPAAFLLFRSIDRVERFAISRLLPLVVCLVLAVFTQGRGWTLLCLLAFGIYFYRLRQSDERWAGALMAVIATAIIGTVLFLLFSRNIQPAFEGLMGRLSEETRLGQYQEFFSQIDVLSLIPGLGPHASYRMGEADEYQFFDNQFIWILFIAGLPTLLAYGDLILRPAGQILLNWVHRSSRLSAAHTLALWALGMAGASTFMSIGVDFPNLMIALLAGRCHAQLAERGEGESSR